MVQPVAAQKLEPLCDAALFGLKYTHKDHTPANGQIVLHHVLEV